MGQAAVDLPDPLEPPPVSAASTDDLLAQLAGEEIDRLLAQDESAPKPPSEPIAAVQAAPLSEPAAATAQSAAPEPTTGAQLNELLNELESGTRQDPIPPTPAATTPAATAPDSHPPSDLLEDDATRAAERGALAAPAPAEAPAPHVIPSDALVAIEDAPPIDPLYVRILEAINAPLAACSDDVRAAVGKIAILTAVNSLAILIYVCFFRRH